MRKLILFALSLSLTTPIISEAASSAATDHRAMGFIPKYRRKHSTKLIVPVSNHVHEVHMHQGKVIKIRVVEPKTGKVQFLGFPYGLDPVIKAGNTAIITKHSKASFQQFIDAHLKTLELAKNVAPQIANSPLKPSIPLKSARMASMVTTASVTTPSYPTDCNTTTSLSPTSYSCSLSAAADTATGLISGSACYNFNSVQSNSQISTSFLAQTSTNSLSQQMNASGSINGTYGMFSASADFTIGESYESSSTSGSLYLDFANVREFTNTLDTTYPLSQYGRQAVSTNTFAGSCGDRFVETIWGGMLIVGNLTWSSTSTTNSQNISTSVSGSYGLNTITTAVSTAKTNSDTSSKIGYTTQIFGGGTQAQATVLAADSANKYASSIGNTVNSDKELCFTGNTTACTTYISELQSAAITANSQYETAIVDAKTGLLVSNLDSVFLFPNGVKGTAISLPVPSTSTALSYMNVIDPSNIITAATNALNNTTTFSFTANSALINYKTQINNYLTILNQIATLYERANVLLAALSVNTNFNPSSEMNDIGSLGILGQLKTTYLNDRTLMVNNLKACFATETATTALTDCAPIINLYTTYNPSITTNINSVWDWYTQSYKYLVSGLTSTTQVFSAETQAVYVESALQNSLALQYKSVFTAHNPLGSSYAQNTFGYLNDVLWVTNLSSPWNCLDPNPYTCSTFEVANINSTPDPQGMPALITFNDYNWVGLLADSTGKVLKSWVNLMPINSTTPSMLSIGSLNSDLTPVVSPYRYTVYNLGFSQSYELPPTKASFKATVTGCVQNFSSPCDYKQTATAPANNPSFTVTNTISHIQNFFN